MNKVILGTVLIAIFSIFLISCNKDDLTKIETATQDNSSSTDDISTISNKNIVILRCDLNRKGTGCHDGWGICNCEWFPDAPWKSMEGNLNPGTNQLTLHHISFIDNGKEIFYVDEDIVLPPDVALDFGYQDITIVQGEYVKDYTNNQSVTVDVILN